MTVTERIVSDFQHDHFFEDYKFIKSKHAFVKKYDWGWYQISLRPFNDFEYINIRPLYEIRFNILVKWFEKFSFKTLKDQRSNSTVFFEGENFGFETDFYFDSAWRDYKNYDILYPKFRNTVVICATKAFNLYTSLEDYYRVEIVPVLNRDKELPMQSADWFFKYLTACKIVAPDKYPVFKEIMLKHADKMMERNEPNMAEYYNRLDEILSYMESIDFSQPLKKQR